MQGNLEANLLPEHANLNMEGKDASKLQSSFGSLKKEELHLQKLLQDSKDRIVTTQPSSVIEEVKQTGTLGGLLSLCGPKSLKVSFKENANLSKDSNVTMEIPPRTTIAYSLSELVVKPNGHYELCLMPDTNGGFEVDGPKKNKMFGSVGGAENASNWLKQELDELSSHFQLLSDLKAPTRSSLLQLLTAAIKEREAVCLLDNVLEQMHNGECPSLDSVEVDSQRQTIQAILDVLELSDGEKSVESSRTQLAVHLITSALDALKGKQKTAVNY
ncbi:hypothetical protein CRUP_004416 [Coryphaenoides rupestris]|nr:hypothetical protein CRUP_004416 [Coryphaenoides rupestris]